MQLALRMQEQQSLQQATNNALEQQELQTATVAAALAERKQAKLRRQMLMRNCLQRYETSPVLLQTCLAQVRLLLAVQCHRNPFESHFNSYRYKDHRLATALCLEPNSRLSFLDMVFHERENRLQL